MYVCKNKRVTFVRDIRCLLGEGGGVEVKVEVEVASGLCIPPGRFMTGSRIGEGGCVCWISGAAPKSREGQL